MSDIHARPPILLFMKAVTKKQVWVPGYTKRNGQVVQGHHQWVNVSSDHDDHAVVSGNGTVSQKKAHEKMSKQAWFSGASHEHKLAHLLHESTKIADEKYITDQLSRIKSNAIKDKKILTGEWKTYQAVSAEKRKPIDDAIKAAGKWESFSAAFEAWDKANPKAAEPAQAAATPEPKAEPKLEPEKAPEAAPEPAKVVAAEEKEPEPEARPTPSWLNPTKPSEATTAHLAAASKKLAEEKAAETSAPAAAGELAMPDFTGGKNEDPKFVQYYEGVAKKIIEHAQAGNVQVLEDLKEAGLQPNAKTGKVGNTWKGKTQNSKKLLALYDTALAHAKGGEQPMESAPADIPAPDKEVPKVVSDMLLKHPDGIGSKTWDEVAAFAANGDKDGLIAYGKSKTGETKMWVADVLHSMGMPAPEAAGAVANEPPKAAAPAPKEPTGGLFDDINAAAEKGDMATLKDIAAYAAKNGMQKTAEHAAKKIGELATKMTAEPAASLPVLDTSDMSDLHKDAAKAIHDLATKGSAVGHVGGQVSNLQDYFSAFDYAGNNLDDKKIAAYAKDALASLGEEAKHSGATSVPSAPAAPTLDSNGIPEPHVALSAHGEKFAFAIKDIKDWGNQGDVSNLLNYAKHANASPHAGVPELGKYAEAMAKWVEKETAAEHAAAAPVKPNSNFTGAVSQIEQALKQGKSNETLENWAKYDAKGQPDFQEVVDYAKQVKDAIDAKAPQAAATAAANPPVKPDAKNYSVALKDIEDAFKAGKKDDATLHAWAGENGSADPELAKVVNYAKEVIQALNGGPKEGDTKMGADGMLVFKNGRWHKQGEKKKGPSAAAAAESVKMPKLFKKHNSSHADKLAPIMGELKKVAIEEGADGLAEHVQILPNGNVKVKGLIEMSPTSPKPSTNTMKFAQYVKELHAAVVGAGAVGSGISTSPATSAPAAQKVTGSTVTTTESVDGWKQIGPQGGYNPGGTYEDVSGQQWYVKFPAGGEKIARNELLATKLYALAGVEVPEVKLINQGGKIGLASKIIDGAVANKSALLEGKAKGLLQGFGADAWLANWDAVGNNPAAGKGFDNILIKPDGSAVRIDAGGALLYGGAGGKKQTFEDEVIELKTMLDPAKNPNTAAVFGKMGQGDIAASVAKVAAISDAHIESLVQTYGPGSAAEKSRLAAKLIARKEDMIKQYPSAAKAAAPKLPKAAVDPNDTSWVKLKPGQKIAEHGVSDWGVQFAKIENPPSGFNADTLPQPKEYTASSSAHVNKQNTADMQKLFDTAKETQSADAVQGTKFDQIVKATGEKTGKQISIDEHPSKAYVKEYANQLSAELKAQTEPTFEMQTNGSASKGYSSIARSLAAKVKAIAYEQFKGWKDKAADYLILNKDAADGIPMPEAGMFKKVPVTDPGIVAFKAASDANFEKLPQSQKDACKKYTGNSVYGKWNSALRLGEVDSADFAGSKPMRDAFKKAAVELPEGIILQRGIGVGSDTYKSVIGAVIQDGSFQSASYGEQATAAFGHSTQLRLHITKGVKGMMATTFSNYGTGEREVVLHPNCRYVVMKVEPANGYNYVDILVLPHEE